MNLNYIAHNCKMNIVAIERISYWLFIDKLHANYAEAMKMENLIIYAKPFAL